LGLGSVCNGLNGTRAMASILARWQKPQTCVHIPGLMY
jgi:hypothetical protein